MGEAQGYEVIVVRVPTDWRNVRGIANVDRQAANRRDVSGHVRSAQIRPESLTLEHPFELRQKRGTGHNFEPTVPCCGQERRGWSLCSEGGRNEHIRVENRSHHA